MDGTLDFDCHRLKGQLISKGFFVSSKFKSTKKTKISALASKERSNQKNKGTLLY